MTINYNLIGAEVETIVLDVESIQLFYTQICDSDEGVVAELTGLYLKSLDTLVAEMQEAVHQADPVLLRRAAHTLKSSSRIFGAEQLSFNCAQLEEVAVSKALIQAPPLLVKIIAQALQMHELLPLEFRRLSRNDVM